MTQQKSVPCRGGFGASTRRRLHDCDRTAAAPERFTAPDFVSAPVANAPILMFRALQHGHHGRNAGFPVGFCSTATLPNTAERESAPFMDNWSPRSSPQIQPIGCRCHKMPALQPNSSPAKERLWLPSVARALIYLILFIGVPVGALVIYLARLADVSLAPVAVRVTDTGIPQTAHAIVEFRQDHVPPSTIIRLNDLQCTLIDDTDAAIATLRLKQPMATVSGKPLVASTTLTFGSPTVRTPTRIRCAGHGSVVTGLLRIPLRIPLRIRSTFHVTQPSTDSSNAEAQAANRPMRWSLSIEGGAVSVGVHGTSTVLATAHRLLAAPTPRLALNTTGWTYGVNPEGQAWLTTGPKPLGAHSLIGMTDLTAGMDMGVSGRVVVHPPAETIRAALLTAAPSLRSITMDGGSLSLSFALATNLTGPSLMTMPKFGDGRDAWLAQWATVNGVASSLVVSAAPTTDKLELLELPDGGVVMDVSLKCAGGGSRRSSACSMWPTLLRDHTHAAGGAHITVGTRAVRSSALTSMLESTVGLTRHLHLRASSDHGRRRYDFDGSIRGGGTRPIAFRTALDFGSAVGGSGKRARALQSSEPSSLASSSSSPLPAPVAFETSIDGLLGADSVTTIALALTFAAGEIDLYSSLGLDGAQSLPLTPSRAL